MKRGFSSADIRTSKETRSFHILNLPSPCEYLSTPSHISQLCRTRQGDMASGVLCITFLHGALCFHIQHCTPLLKINDALEHPSLLGCDAVPLRTYRSFENRCAFKNPQNYSPTNTVSHPKRTESAAISPSKLGISQIMLVYNKQSVWYW